ncbi:uncharacterized protein LOC142547795 isoform X2 [Primulina tabacum]|uniref:uncharacterized protein LOC142547795 isoform X2 n=1 Tax=Primulina tabacum TaxID=48773 RepID=UPI003F595415
MSNADSTSSTPPPAGPLSAKKENVIPISPKIAELAESRQELMNRIQTLKQDLQNWRLKMDTQELSELKNSIYSEVEQLRSEFKELRSTLQQQQEDVTASLKNLGLQDVSAEAKEGLTNMENGDDTTQDSSKDDNGKEMRG